MSVYQRATLAAMGPGTNPAELHFAGRPDPHGVDAELKWTALA